MWRGMLVAALALGGSACTATQGVRTGWRSRPTLRSGYHHYYEQDGTPGGTYMTDPPVFRGKTCRKQALFPVAGHRLTPGSQLPIYIVLRAVRPAPRGSIYGRPLPARH